MSRKETMKKNYIIGYPTEGCTNDQRNFIVNAMRWFLEHHDMQLNEFDGEFDNVKISVSTKTFDQMDCYGQCYESENKNEADYIMEFAMDQPTRELLATIMHECIHLLQWERGTWDGDGEEEAWSFQYKLADKYWREGHV